MKTLAKGDLHSTQGEWSQLGEPLEHVLSNLSDCDVGMGVLNQVTVDGLQMLGFQLLLGFRVSCCLCNPQGKLVVLQLVA